ncbi:hypothetical protein FVEG_15996 [Fusarium verticillioides 7600]|uniref:Myb-like domain-containing protein n=1 Tax=Gibberella moniliformis (strain M3125 / FGSC 7600) TaxID=334819 RepID=W7M4R5_GIBM7|nr:hypothetical protein FVEG_15996 [Fusarium verticillioides 7600]EWG46573.1 hypothetical protein FVEG_15996 [Fusarium verticillioides 7600]
MKRNPLEDIAQRAKLAGYQYGEHIDRDKERSRIQKQETINTQDHVLQIYQAWWANANGVPPERYDEILSLETPLPKIEELKDFWRFYALQSSGRITLKDGSRTKCPTVRTLLKKAAAWKAGFQRRTGQMLSDEDTTEINMWLSKSLPYEERQGNKLYCHNMAKPKFNFESLDLDQLINQVWNGQDTKHIHDRNRLQFHLQLLIFCDSGARRGAILSHGVPYKDIQLVLRPHDDEPPFFYKLAQRHTKNNHDPELRTFGNACSQHRVLRYDSVSIILMLAVVDGALDLEDLYRMIKNGGEGPVEWNERCRDMPICREVDRQGNIDETKPMSPDMFVNMFRMFQMQAGYTAVPGTYFNSGSIHMIRRALGKQLDERYTEVERSQHLTQADKSVFGRSYTADTSSCDGLSAFLGEKPDHRAVRHFQGITQFRQEGLPTQLPAALKDKINSNPEILEWDQKIAQASDDKAQKKFRQKRHKAFERLQRWTLEEYRRETSMLLKREKLLNGTCVKAPGPDPDDPIHKLRPEKVRLAEKMARTSPTTNQDRIDAMRDMLLLLSAPTVYYRREEEPKDKKCPFCLKEIESIASKRLRCNHIHRCRQKATAKNLGVLFSNVKFCYFCNLFLTQDEWEAHCQTHLKESLKYCGSITYRHTLIRPAFCLLCRQSEKSPAMRMLSWERDVEAIRHMEKEHQWPWSCADCEFLGENGDACYYHLHDAHGYQLPKERKFEASSNSASFILQDNSDDWISEYIQFPPHSPELSGIAVKGNETMPSLTLPWKLEHEQPFEVVTPQMKAIDDTIHGHRGSLEERWDCHLFSDLPTNLAPEQLSPLSSIGTALAEGMPSMAIPFDDKEHSQLNTLSMDKEVPISPIRSASWLPTLTDVGQTGAESAQCHTLDLASTAKSSLALLAACSPDSDESPRDKDVQDLTAGPTAIDHVRSSHCDMSPLPTPCVTADTGIDTGDYSPGPLLVPCDEPDYNTGSATCGYKKRRIKLITAPCEPEVGDVESLPKPKKRRIILIIKPRTTSNAELADVESAAPEAEVDGRDKTTEPESPTKIRTRIRWTSEEDGIICRLKQENYSWAEIQHALPHRSLGSMQVRYSTVLRRSSGVMDGRKAAGE